MYVVKVDSVNLCTNVSGMIFVWSIWWGLRDTSFLLDSAVQDFQTILSIPIRLLTAWAFYLTTKLLVKWLRLGVRQT